MARERYLLAEVGKRVWIENAEGAEEMFSECIVREIDEEKHVIGVEEEGGKVVSVGLERCLKCTYGEADVSDMVDLEELNEPELLWNIKRRYVNDEIFTLCGPTLVIINPYRLIEKLITNEKLY